MLFFIIISKISKKRFLGKLVDILSLLEMRKCFIEEIPISASIFVYIDFASAVNKRALLGSCSSLISSMKEVESFKYDCTRWISSFIL